MRILIIGGAGLIGSQLAYYLVNDGHDVLILDNFTLNAKEHSELPCEVVTGNSCSFSTVNLVFASFSPDVVFHFACNPYDKEGTYEVSEESNVIISTTNNILKCIDIYRPKYIFYGSSGEVYKGGSKRKVSEISTVGNFSYTGATNLYVENMFYLASKQYTYIFTSLRFFHIFGPRKFLNPKHDVASFFIDSIIKNDNIVVVGPETYIDVLGFNDAAKASYLIFKTVVSGNVLHNVNIGSGEPIKLYELYKEILKLSKNKKERVFKFPNKRQVRSLVANIEKLKTLGWEQNDSIKVLLTSEINRREKLLNE